MKYRNRIEVDAWRVSAATRPIIKKVLNERVWWYDSNGDNELYIDNSNMRPFSNNCASEGDWIISHPTQGLSIMSDDEFQATYAPA